MTRTMTITPNQWGAALFGAVFCAVALGMGWFFQIAPWLQSREVLQSWRRTPAIILSHNFVYGDGETASYSDISYEYVFDGRKYHSKSVSIWPHHVAYGVNQVKPGFQMECYVNPANPAESLLAADAPLSWFWGILLGIFLLGGLFSIFHAFSRGQRPPEPIFRAIARYPTGMTEVSTLPVLPEGSPCRSRELYIFDNHLEYRARKLYHGIALVFFLISAGVSIYGVMNFPENLFWFIFGLIIAGSTIQLWRAMTAKRAVFDLETGIYYCDKRTPRMVGDPQELKDFTPLKEVVALQLLASEIKQKDQPPYICYELNLVKRNGWRINVIAHLKREHLIRDAQIIAETLHVPLLGSI